MRSVWKWGVAAAIAVLCSPAAGAQIANGRVLLATVVDLQGKPRVDLGVDDFVISEGGHDREVLDVHIADYPVVVLVDDTADETTKTTIKRAVTRFITRIGERPVAFGALSGTGELLATLESDRATVLARLEELPASAGDTIAPLPTVANAARVLADTGAPFSAIVVVTARAIDATRAVQGDLLPAILESGAAVHVVEYRTASAGDAGLEEAPDLLRLLADQTKGQYTRIFSPASYAIALDRLADRLAAEMMAEYLVPPGERAGDVRVGVRKPGLHVLGLGVSK
jgi:hypothetical protein